MEEESTKEFLTSKSTHHLICAIGKSSILNQLMRQKLCLTSKSPGRTQQAYYYGLIPNKHLPPGSPGKSDSSGVSASTSIGFAVDLPGYGFAQSPDKVVGNWQSRTQDLLLDRQRRGVLQRLYLLIDCRREDGPQPADRTVMGWLDEAEIPYTMVLTKADAVAVPLVLNHVNNLCTRYASQYALEEMVFQSPVVHITSSSKGFGVYELMHSVETDFLASQEE